jgi:hypothetical protein
LNSISENAGGKNEVKSHDVIENTCRKMSVYGLARMFMKTK